MSENKIFGFILMYPLMLANVLYVFFKLGFVPRCYVTQCRKLLKKAIPEWLPVPGVQSRRNLDLFLNYMF